MTSPASSPPSDGALATGAGVQPATGRPYPTPSGKPPRWAYGITTVPSRLDQLFPATLESLRHAGFGSPRVFVDGEADPHRYLELGFHKDQVTVRWPQLRVAGHWVLSLYELYLREPAADRYALFQDDFVTYPNLRQYLERCPYPERGYWNLYTFPSNQTLCPKDGMDRERLGWYKSNQFGRGAVALVFDKETVITLLSQRHLVERVQDMHRGHRCIDGGVVTALQQAGWTEYVHNPSLVQHRGLVSAAGNRPHLQAISFRGDQFDALQLLGSG